MAMTRLPSPSLLFGYFGRTAKQNPIATANQNRTPTIVAVSSLPLKGSHRPRVTAYKTPCPVAHQKTSNTT
jgi:hypothetical protein